MSRIDNVIKEIKASRTGKYCAWIYNENGELKDNVIIGDIIPYLEELKDYEIEKTDEEITEFVEKCFEKYTVYNTYNQGANISNDIQYCVDGNIVAFCIHLSGDIRCNYTDYFICEFDYESQMYELENVRQNIMVTDNYIATVDIFCETYEVWSCDTDYTVGDFYDIEKEELLDSIKTKLLPNIVTVNINELNYSAEDNDNLLDSITNYLTDTYEYCTVCFDYDTDIISGDITITNIEWDID